jgi:cytochrome c-type biogenesis protein CcmH/NrfG
MPHLYLGYWAKEQGQKQKAVAEFQRYLSMRPDADDRKDVEREIEYLGGK